MMHAVRSLARRLGAAVRARRSPEQFVRVCGYAELAAGDIRRVDGLPIVVCRAAARVYALGVSCPHSGASLAKGRLVDGCLECPLHGARFALADGAVRRGPAGRRLASYDVELRDGDVYVSRLPRRAFRRRRGR